MSPAPTAGKSQDVDISRLLSDLKAKGLSLRPYQEDGVQFMLGTQRAGHGCILADEMGLGKTAQSIAALGHLRAESTSFRALVVCPLSVLQHWEDELGRFGIKLRSATFHGPKEERAARKAALSGDPGWAVLLTTYEMALKEAEWLGTFAFAAAVLDEAHRLKNHESLLYTTFRGELRISWSLLLTGTPVQNNLGELYALLHFIHPAQFPIAGLEAFRAQYDSKDEQKMRALRGILEQYMLRRTKSVVCTEIPEKTEVLLFHGISKLQRDLYRAILSKNYELFQEEGDGSSRRQSLMNTMMQLRKCVNHPYLFQGVEPEPFAEGEHLVSASGKLGALDALLRHLKAGGHRVLLFSQMTAALDVLQDFLSLREYSYERLDGSIRSEERFAAVKRFNDKAEETFVFLLSTRAGGLGLTLTAADTVIFFDSDFNPQNDVQAAARAHRIGQTRPVKIIRLIARHTVEELIRRRAAAKLRLTAAVIADAEEDEAAKMSAAEISDFITRGLGKLDEAAEATVDVEAILGPSKDGRWAEQRAAGKSDDPEAKAEVENMYEFEGEDYKAAQKAKDLEALGLLVKEAQELVAADTGPGSSGRRGKPVIRFELALPTPRKQLTPEQLEERRVKREAAAAKRKEAQAAAMAEAERERAERRAEKWAAAGYESTGLPGPEEGEAPKVGDPLEPVYLSGDVVHPQPAAEHKEGDALILHVLDDSGSWASGGVFGAISRRSPSVEAAYVRAGRMRDLRPGDVHLLRADDVESRAGGRDFVALILAQDRRQRSNIDQGQLAEALRKIALHVETHPGTTVHMPRIGFGLPKVNWYAIERLVRKYLCGAGVPTYIYYFKKGVTSQAKPRKRDHGEGGEASNGKAARLSTQLCSAFAAHRIHVDRASFPRDTWKQLERFVMAYDGDLVTETGDVDGSTIVVATADKAAAFPSAQAVVSKAFIEESVLKEKAQDLGKFGLA